MKVRITEEAQADLADLVAWIERDDPAAAVRFGDALVAKALEIGRMPLAFPAVAGRGSDLRKRTHRKHAIIYRVSAEVEILRIIDTRRDYMTLLEDL